MGSTKRLAVVTPWFGKDLKGGAEQQAWQVSTRLAQRGHHVDVLTTCCRSFQDDWATSHWPPGKHREHGITIRRFLVDRRDRASFDAVNAHMLSLPHAALKPGVNPVSEEQAAIFVTHNINSSALLQYLQDHRTRYHAVLFMPYLYGPILRGLPLVADRAFLQPCLHDEVYAYLPQVDDLFRLAKGLLFLSEGEALLADRLYGPGIVPRAVTVGTGVEFRPGKADTAAILGSLTARDEPFVLYLGRRDPTKNTDLLVGAYARFKRENPASPLKLVLAGPGDASYAVAEGIRDLGLVSEPQKAALLLGCRALFQPSRNESYSRVIMEAWLCGRPVAAHRLCLATATAVQSAEGGWLAETEAEWAALFGLVDRNPATDLGTNGRRYAEQHADWDRVMARYESALRPTAPATSPARRLWRGLREIHQLLPDLAYGDAISNEALAIRDRLHMLGYTSEIFSCRFDTRVAQEANRFSSEAIDQRAGLLYHHSIGSEVTGYAIRHPGPKCLIYHNITPGEFFEPFRPEFARLVDEGRQKLRQLVRHFPLAVGDSAYNALELAAHGFRNPGVLPLPVGLGRFNISGDRTLIESLQDGVNNLLFVGRLAPNKRQDRLVGAFYHYLRTDPDARLIVVGGCEPGDPYMEYLTEIVERLGLKEHVLFPGLVSDAELVAYYRTAHLFWSMSEHEGFCVPLVEAMWFDVPVLAYRSSAIPGTLEDAGVTFDAKDLAVIAGRAKELVHDQALRARVLAAQRKRRTAFLPQACWDKLDELLAHMQAARPAECRLRSEARTGNQKRKVAFVVQRCGLEVNGGAEALCLTVARRMTRYWDVEVLTTCAVDYMTWENHYPSGEEDIGGLTVRRFPVAEPRDVGHFNQLSEAMAPRKETVPLDEQESWMRAQGPWSPQLMQFVERYRGTYDAFIFFCYLYGTTYFTLPLVEDKAYLVPLAHDEWPIYLSMWDRFFARPRGLIFNTPEERAFFRSRFPRASIDGPVVGVAVDVPAEPSPDRFRARYGIRDPFLLYVGRIDVSKGCEELCRYFLASLGDGAAVRRLVLAGRAVMPVPEHPAINALGFVDEETKWDALAACEVLVMPSRYESLSMALLEAWAVGKPVLVNGACDVLVGQCRRAQGGLFYTSGDEFAATLSTLLNPDIGPPLGRQGQAFVRRAYSWDRVERAYKDLLSL
jgi:glycosyltransferase involved in cell wall biosynthesis